MTDRPDSPRPSDTPGTPAPGSAPGTPRNPEAGLAGDSAAYPTGPHAAFIARSTTDEADITARMRKAKVKPNIRVPALNITSFLDMSFALLTMLILLADFSAGEGVLTATIPVGMGGTGTSDSTQMDKLPITIIVNPIKGQPDTCIITVDGVSEFDKVASFTELGDKLIRVRKDPKTNPRGTYDSDTPIIIRPEANITWQHVVNAFNAAVRARFTKVSFAQTAEKMQP